MKKQNPTKPDFRVRLETADGVLVANREANPDYYFGPRGFDREFAKIALTGDCREKGVKLLRYTHDKNGVYAIVEWL